MPGMLIHPFQTSDENSGDATAITGAGEENELRRAIVLKGYDWVNMVRYLPAVIPRCLLILS